MKISGAQQRRASAKGQPPQQQRERGNAVDRNKTDSIAWAKERRAKAVAAEEKRAERKRVEAAAIAAQEKYEAELEDYKQRGYAPSHAFEANGGGGGGLMGRGEPEPAASWEDTPIGAAVPNRVPARHQQQQPSRQPRRQQQQQQQQDDGGIFGRNWNDGFADGGGGGWNMMSDSLLEEPPPPPPPPKQRSSARGQGRGRGAAARGGRGGEDRGGRGEGRAPGSSRRDVKQVRERRKQEEQESHEEALRQARIQAAAERRLAADRARMHDGGGGNGGGRGGGDRGGGGLARSPRGGGSRSPELAPAVQRRSPTLSAKQRGAAVAPRTNSSSPRLRGPAAAEAMLDAALASMDPSNMSWADMQRMMDMPADEYAASLAPPPNPAGAIGSDGLVGMDHVRPLRAKPKLSSRRRAEYRERDKEEEEDDTGIQELPPHMVPGDPRAPEPEPESPPAPRTRPRRAAGGGDGGEAAFSEEEGDGEQRQRQQRRRTPPRKPRSSTTGPGKAAKAAMEIEAKRKARREAAEKEKARREAEIAEHGDAPNVLFRRLIGEFRSDLDAGKRKVPGARYPSGQEGGAKAAGQGSLLVCVRKRPMLLHREVDEYDVLTAAGDRALICHEPRTKMDMSQTMEHHQFLFDHVFDEESSTADVYHEAVAPSLHATLESQLGGQRGNLTVFAYGQTGSGKTFTMEPIYAQTVAEALHACQQYEDVQLSISFFEIYCAKVFDLLRGRAEVRTLEDAKGEVQVENLAEAPVYEFDAAMDTIERGQKSRVTHANAVHADSSRSHAVLTLLIRSQDEEEEVAGASSVAGYRTDEQREFVGRLLGKLVLVDLAGSERASETLSDDKATRHEGAEINKSLLALKECIRALGRGDKHKQFRGSKLTQVLRDGLSGQHSRAVMMACLSPAAKNTEHTLNTLRYADRLKEIGGGRSAAAAAARAPGGGGGAGVGARQPRGSGR